MVSTYDPRLPTPYVEREDLQIYRFGDLFVNALCPDFELDVALQEGNTRPRVKIQPKKSWELKDNRIGASTPGEPRSALADFQPWLPINLIDGDPRTFWVSRGQAIQGEHPEWIRIDLAKESQVREIVLVPRRDGQGLPGKLRLEVSRDAFHWTKIYETEGLAPPEKPGEPLHFPLTNPRPVKQVRITADDVPLVRPGAYGWDHHFSLVGIQVIDSGGNDVALAARGAGITVSSTDHGIRLTHKELDMLWPIHFDIGFKWVRLAYCEAGNSPLQWYYVERERGKYEIDARADEAITQTVAAGINIVLALSYGNWLYADEPEVYPQRTRPELWQMINHMPPWPTSPQMREGFRNYVRFMVRHFKDRIRYYELWNEQDGWGISAEQFVSLVKEIAPIVKEEYPEAKVVLGSVASGLGPYLHACLELGVGPYVDVIGFHPLYNINPASHYYIEYPRLVREFQAFAEAHGFHGEYMNTEYHWIADYPPSDRQKGTEYFPSEMQKAKNLACGVIESLALNVFPFWCETWNSQQCDIGLLRNVFSGDSDVPVAAEPAYYVMRTLCTLLAGTHPVDLPVSLSDGNRPYRSYAFRNEQGELLVAVWAAGATRDDHHGLRNDVLLAGIQAASVHGVDALNGFEQELNWQQQAQSISIPGVLVRDYPLVLRVASA